MAGKTYNAGTIFLQVVPVFGDVQNSIRRQARDINRDLSDEMEKGGEEAGRKASEAMGKELEKGAKQNAKTSSTEFQREFNKSIKGMQDSLEPINLRFQSNDISRQIKEIRAELEELSKKKINTELDAKEAEAAIRVLHAQLQGLAEDAKLNAKLDIKRAIAAAEALEKRLDTLHKAAEIEVRLETKQADRAMGAFEKKMRETARRASAHLGDSMNPAIKRIKAELDGLADAEIGIDISDEEARARIERLTREVRDLSLDSPEIDVKVNAGAAEVELSGLIALVNRIDGREVDIPVDVDSGAAVAKLTLLRRLQKGLFDSDSAESAANSFRSFNAVVLAAVLLIPALVPVIGAAGGALLALIPILGAVGAGLGAMLVGFSGIGPALTALSAQANHSAYDSAQAAKTMRSAAYAVADAQTALADATRSSAQSQADAARQVADARRAAAQAIEDALQRQADAQKSYRDSVQDVQDAEQALRDARKQAAAEMESTKDKIKSNALDIREAQLAAFDTTNNYNAVMADGASTAYDKEAAQVAMLQAREHLHELRDEAKALEEQQKKGAKGTDAVQSAQDALTAAIDRQKEAQQALGDAAKAVDDARVEGARRVQDALRNQARAQADGVRSVARAQEQLRRAQEGYNQALYDTSNLGSASARNVRAAMKNLGPAGRHFARFLFGMRKDFYAFRDAIQSAMLPGVERAINSLINTYGPQFTDFMARMGDVVGDFFKRLARSLEGPAWRRFFGIMDELGPKMARQFGKSTLNWLETFANIMTAVAPFAEDMSKAMLRMSKAVRDWSASKKGSDAVTGFMEYAERIGPKVMDFLGAFVDAAVNLGKAIAPWGEMILSGLTALLEWIAAMDPKTLGTIVAAILTMVIAWQAAVGAVALFFGGASAFQTLAGRLVFSFIGIIGVLAILYQRFEIVRTVVDALTGFLWDHRKAVMAIISVVTTAIAMYKVYRATVALVKAVQLGLAAATYGAAGAAYAQTGAARAAYVAARIWAGAQWLVTAAMNGTLWSLIKTRAATVAQFVTQKAIAAGTKAWAAAQWLLNAAMRANPLALALTAVIALAAGMVWAYKHFEGFRKVVDAVIHAVADAFHWLWDFLFGHSVMPDIIDGMKWFFDTLKDIFGWIKDDVIEPLAEAFEWMWEKAIKPALDKITAAIKTAWKVIKWAWGNILKPVLTTIAEVIWALWKTEFKVALVLIKAAFKTTFKAIGFVWDHILHPVFKAIGKVMGWLWKTVFKPILGWIGDKWGDMIKGFKIMWDKYGQPIFDWIGDKVLPKLKSAFQTAVDGIKSIWEGLRKIVGVPIRFVINTVIRDGLVAGFNKVANWVGMDGFDFKGVDWQFASGGVMPGYTPGRDVHDFVSPTAGRLRLSGGEAVMRPEWTAAMGSDYVNQMNSLAARGGVNAIRKAMYGGAFASGGIFWPLPGSQFKAAYTGAPGWSTYPGHDGIDLNTVGEDYGKPFYAAVPGRVSYVGYAHGYGNAIFEDTPWGQIVYGHGSRTAVRAGQSVRPGQYIGNVGSTGHSSGPHLHFGFPGGTPLQALQLLAGAAKLDMDQFVEGPSLPHIPGWLKNIVLHPISTVKNWITGPIERASDAISGTPLFKAVTSLPKKAISGMADKVMGIIPDWVKDTVGYIGRAAHDVVSSDQGTDTSGLATVGLAKGGILPYNGTMMYDSGGYLPPGLTNVINLTGRPEPVFTADQFARMDRGGDGGGFTYAPTFEGSDLTPKDVMDDFEFTYRKVHRGGGKYQGVKG